MRLLARSLVLLSLIAAPVLTTSRDADASVSIAVGYDALVKDADAVAVIVPQEAKSVWEDGRICTYTRLKVEQSVAGQPGGEVWVRTLGGVVDKIGQLVDGEAVFQNGKSSLTFLRKYKDGATWEVSARGQGQFPIVVDDLTKVKKAIRSYSAGMLLPPKVMPKAALTDGSGPLSPAAVTQSATQVKLAGEALHDRPLDDVTKEIAANWKRLHPPAK